jgi:acetoin utilization protein AcuB
MLVQDRMSAPAVTASPETETTAALQTMYLRKIRRLPVVDPQGKLLGIVTRQDLLQKGKAVMAIGQIMTPDPHTTTPRVSIVQAALLMRNLGIGALPVVDHGQVVGIITESDIFDAFLELLGARRTGTRLVVPIPDVAGGVARVLQALSATQAPVTGLTTYTDGGGPVLIITAAEWDPRDLIRALRSAGLDATDISVQREAA